MRKIYSLFALIIIVSTLRVHAQGGVAINTVGAAPDSSALLDVSSTLKGTLITRMSTAQRDAIANPAEGLTIFNTDCHVYNYNAGTPSSPDWATINASNVLVAGVSITASPAGAICAGTSVTFSATPSQNNLSPSYQWQVNGQNVGTNSATYTTSGLNSGDVVTCILTSSVPCVTGSPATSNAIPMLVNIVPEITGSTPAGFCSGSAVTLSASANLGTINWYSVSTGGSSLSSGASFTISGLTSSTTYYVDASANGCTTAARTAVTATFYPGSPQQPGAITGPTDINTDSVATYSIAALPNTATYAWTVALGIITSGQGTTSITVVWNDTSGIGSVSVVANNPCGSSAAQTIPVYSNSHTFSYTGSQQIFTVPVGINSVTIAAYGAQGGSQYGNGALGGSATGTLAVTPGQVLNVFVGGQNGYNGGGAGGGVGGGMSDVRVGGTTFANWVIVAGGGGGGGSNGSSYINTTTGTGGGGSACANGAGGGGGGYATSGSASQGGAGSCTTGGGSGYSSGGWAGGAGGGGLTSGGTGGASGGYGNAGGDGTQGQGGDAASGCGCGTAAAGGGGGGYYGGGGASAGCCAGGSGGGGSSWASGAMTNTGFSGGVQSGNGKVVITW